MSTWGKSERRRKRRLDAEDINHKHTTTNFILDVLIGMGMGLLVSVVVIVLVIAVWDVVRGSIPLMGLISAIEMIT